MNFGIPEHYKKRIDAFTLLYPYAFYVYGSRARGKQKNSSDLDFCILGDINLNMLAEIKEGLNNLMLPFSVDVVSWKRLSDEFRSIIQDDLVPYVQDRFLGAQINEISRPFSPGMPLVHEKNQSLNEGLTHIIFPANTVTDRKTVGTVDNRILMAPCSILFAPDARQESFVLTEQMIKKYEHDYGPIPEQSWLLIKTDGSGQQEPISNSNRDVVKHSIGISQQAAEYLVQKKILGLGTDALLLDGSIQKVLSDSGAYVINDLVFSNQQQSNRYFLQVIPFYSTYVTNSYCRIFLLQS